MKLGSVICEIVRDVFLDIKKILKCWIKKILLWLKEIIEILMKWLLFYIFYIRSLYKKYKVLN